MVKEGTGHRRLPGLAERVYLRGHSDRYLVEIPARALPDGQSYKEEDWNSLRELRHGRRWVVEVVEEVPCSPLD